MNAMVCKVEGEPEHHLDAMSNSFEGFLHLTSHELTLLQVVEYAIARLRWRQQLRTKDAAHLAFLLSVSHGGLAQLASLNFHPSVSAWPHLHHSHPGMVRIALAFVIRPAGSPPKEERSAQASGVAFPAPSWRNHFSAPAAGELEHCSIGFENRAKQCQADLSTCYRPELRCQVVWACRPCQRKKLRGYHKRSPCR